MTIIVVEGLDNSGKSTLAVELGKRFDMMVQRGEGPPRPGESINDRIIKYNNRPVAMVYDRHPVVSQPIYTGILGNNQDVKPELTRNFYDSKPILIYCDPCDRGIGQQTSRKGEVGAEHIDTPEYVAELTAKFNQKLEMYRAWAAKHADVFYRIGDDYNELASVVHTLSRYRSLNVWVRRPSNG